MDISFVFHGEKPPEVVAITWAKPAIAYFQLQPDKNQKKERYSLPIEDNNIRVRSRPSISRVQGSLASLPRRFRGNNSV